MHFAWLQVIVLSNIKLPIFYQLLFKYLSVNNKC